ncbi:MAG: tetratricopeptide repeat protein [Faecalibacterium sp.]|jgi:predicted Zn-dependent protease|nr:tetratricopeptide repeat protein [Faecalibacterium sp.]
MDIWNILGLSPTADRAAITKAYHEKLPGANPEDSPEAFKALRTAYEQALALAGQVRDTRDEAEKTAAERWADHLDSLYQEIAARRTPAAWQALLEEDFSLALITRSQARDVLLRYLMEHFFLPQEIWRMLDDFFSLRENVEELYQAFPRDYIEHAVLAGIENDALLPYSLLQGETAAQCDAYLKAYSRCRSALTASAADVAEQCLTEMRNSGAQHPYTLLCEARLALLQQDFAAAEGSANALLAQLPDDPQALLISGQLALHTKDFARAERELLLVTEKEPTLAQAKFDLAASLCGQERYNEAKEIYLKLYRLIPYNSLILEQVHQCNKSILPQREAQAKAAPEDFDNLSELAWCYHQELQEDDALRTLALLPAEQQGTFDYENLASKVYLGSGQMEQALSHLQAWEKAIRAADQTDEQAKSRLPESLRLQAAALASLQRQPEADALLETVTAQWPKDAAAWQMRTQYALEANRLEDALENATHLCDASPGDPYSHYISGVILFRMGRMQESFRCFSAAMQRSGRDAECMLYQARILIGAGQWDDARKLLDDLVFAKVENPTLSYCLARMASHDGDIAKAVEHYLSALPACREKENVPDFAGEVFYRLVCLQYKKRDKKELLGLVDEGLAHDKGSLSLLDLRGDLLREVGRIPEAVAAYEEICRRAPNSTSAFESLGRLYQFCIYDYAKASELYRQQLKNEDTAVVRNLLGLCCQECGRYAEAEQNFLLAVKREPKEFSFRANLAEHYLLTKQYARAERVYRDALALPVLRWANRARLRRQLARLYWRTGRGAEAAAVLEENVTKEFLYSDLLAISDGWARMGDFVRAAQTLERWKALAHPAEGAYCNSRSNLLALQGHYRMAEAVLRFGAQRDRACCRRLAFLYAAQGRFGKAIALYQKLIAAGAAGDVNTLRNFAECLWWAGDDVGAARFARQGLELLARQRSNYNPALYHTQEAAFLIALKDIPRASAALRQAQQCPMCVQCYYGGCKDALGIEGLLQERMGNLEVARALYAQGRQRYPDEFDFTAYWMRLTKRMKQA